MYAIRSYYVFMDLLVGYLPVDFVSVAVLATAYIAASVGGLATSAVAPRLKIGVATATGALFPVAYYLSLFVADWPKDADLV